MAIATKSLIKYQCHMQVHLSRNNVPAVKPPLSRSWTVDFILFFLFILFYFTFLFLFIFLFLEQLRLGFISHAVTNWWHSHLTDHETWEKEVEDSGTKWHHTVWTLHAGLLLYSWSFRVGCTVVSMNYGL